MIYVFRKIDNKLVLGESLVEKGEVLIAAGHLDEAAEIQKEAKRIVEALGNPDLIFKAKIFEVHLTQASGKHETAQSMLFDLSNNYDTDFEQAAINYALFQITQEDTYKTEALERYQNLYKATPLYIFAERIKGLKK